MDADEMKPVRPQVPLVSLPASCACRAVRLARARAGPDGPVVGPPSESERVGPDADPGEEVALGKSGKLGWCDIANVPFIDDTGGDLPGVDQVAQPLGGEWVNLVVIGGHRPVPTPSRSPVSASCAAWSMSPYSSSASARFVAARSPW